MARKSIHDKNQPSLPGFEGNGKEVISEVYQYCKTANQKLKEIIKTHPARPGVEDEYEICLEVAVALKQEIRDSGLSRDEFAEEVNVFFGRTDERHKLDECRKPLTGGDVDKMISDSKTRPIHCYYLFAFQHVLGFGITNTIVGAKGGHIVSQEDRRLLALAQIGELESKMRDAKKTLTK